MELKHQPEKRDTHALPKLPAKSKMHDPSLYRPSEELWAAVQTALHLGLPLLVTGEPGCGKTDLAAHIAWYYKLGAVESFNGQTSTTVTDLFYRYDALRHFQHAQVNKTILTPGIVERDYIKYQALGAAIKSPDPMVVLLDEIDKAPRDLPNNLLAALDKLEFSVPETGDPAAFTFKAKPEQRPVIIMTSNSEKGLPDPFLRRVAFFDIKFPDKSELLKILADKLDDFKKLDADKAVDFFLRIRQGDLGTLNKIPSTAELLHWAAALLKLGVDSDKLDHPDRLDATQRKLLGHSFTVLAKTRNDLPTLRKAIGLDA